jgi:glycosyltransferase involved in cell wall biosynthesis
MGSLPRVSVIVPAYNAARYLPYAIESVIPQTFESWEIVLVDDGSTDGTRELAETYAPRLKDRLRYIYQSNRGLSSARNVGLAAARGEFIALLDADDVWLPRRLERGIERLDSDPELGLVHARVARIDTGGQVVGQLPVEPRYLSGRIARYIYTRRAHIICPTVMFRKSCLSTAGVFDETMKSTEDRDLWFRIALTYKVAFIDEILAYYRISPSSMTKNLDRLLDSQLFFARKHYESGAATRFEYRQAYGNAYRELGDSLFRRGQKRQALANYLRAVRYNPFNVPNLYMAVRALLDPVVVRVLAPRGQAEVV